ncbi:MAG: ribosome biogenesis GTP-binding protein YihA/YsxC [Desulfatiglandales bacterium]
MHVEFVKSAFRESHYPPPDKPEVAFAGRSNVGKSSLINVLVNRKKLARTSSTPGRTQAINFFCVDQRLYLVDLPGYGYARVPLSVKKSWGDMVETYLRSRTNLKAVVLILDIRRDPGPDEAGLLEWLIHYGIICIPVLTKTDKVSRNQTRSRAGEIIKGLGGLLKEPPIFFSAKTRVGKKEVGEAIDRVTDLDLFQGRRP